MICISAVLGSYDTIKPPPTGTEENHIFLDWEDPLAKELGWIVHLRSNNTLSSRYLAKAPKCAPHMLGFKQQDILWIDGSMMPTGVDVREMLELVPEGGIGTFAHRERDCIYKEALFSAMAIDRYSGQPILQQVDHYHKEGHPELGGLYEVGTILWRGAQYTIGTEWLAEQLAWTSQDQVSFPVVCRRNNVVPTILPGTAVENKWLVYKDHDIFEW